MSNTKQTYLYGRCFVSYHSPDLTLLYFLKQHAPSAEIASFPSRALITVRVIKDEINHLLKSSSNPNLYTLEHKIKQFPGGKYVLADKSWTRTHDINADYRPMTNEPIEKQVKTLFKYHKKSKQAQWAAIILPAQMREAKKKVSTYA